MFVTHSSGGLVVKDTLRGAIRDGHVAIPGSDPDAPRSVWLRTRRIIDIAVPHQGGAPFVSWFGKGSYLALHPLVAPVLRTSTVRRARIPDRGALGNARCARLTCGPGADRGAAQRNPQ